LDTDSLRTYLRLQEATPKDGPSAVNDFIDWNDVRRNLIARYHSGKLTAQEVGTRATAYRTAGERLSDAGEYGVLDELIDSSVLLDEKTLVELLDATEGLESPTRRNAMTAVETLDEAGGSADEAVELYAELDTEDLRRFLTVHEAVPADSAPEIDEFDDWSGFRMTIFRNYAGRRGPSASVVAGRVERFETAARAAADDENIDHLGGGVLKDAASGGFNRISERTNEINDALMYSNAGYDVVLEPGTSGKYDSVSSERIDMVAEDGGSEVFVESKYISSDPDEKDISEKISQSKYKFVDDDSLSGQSDKTTLHIRAPKYSGNQNSMADRLINGVEFWRSTHPRDEIRTDVIRIHTGELSPSSPSDLRIKPEKEPSPINEVVVDEIPE